MSLHLWYVSIFFQILMVWQIFINKAPKLNAILLMKNFTHIEITWNYLNWSWNTCLFSQDYNTLFYNYSKPVVVAASVVLVLVCIVFVWFTVHFYRSLVQHKYERSFQGEIFFNRLQTNCTQIQGQYQAHQQAVHVLIMGFEIICITKPSVLHFLLDAPYSYCTSQNLTCNPPFLLLLCYL